jgi:formamidopyrimidine-DNA glycosylase
VPELPEVEIAREELERWLVGRRIAGASAPDARLRCGQSRRRVEDALVHARVRSVARRGKFLVIELSRGRGAIVAHLGMTGRFQRLTRGDREPPFIRAEIGLGGGERVVLSDARRLGQFCLRDRRQEARLEALGLEPLSSELTPERLQRLMERSSRPVKLLLMDQKRIAGVGNIQAAEALFLAGVHPARPARSLSEREVKRLVRSMRRALRAELGRYRKKNAYLYEGAENHFLVYGRGGEPCPRCRAVISRLVQQGRSSYYCPSCQPEGDGHET